METHLRANMVSQVKSKQFKSLANKVKKVQEELKVPNSIKVSEDEAGLTSTTSQILRPNKLSTGITTQTKKHIIEAGAHTRAEVLVIEATNAAAEVARKPISSILNKRKKIKIS